MEKSKTVLITGSSRGIGFEIAKVYAENNHNVVINCKKSQAELIEAENILKKINPNILAILSDVSDYISCNNIFNTIKAKFGAVDILINNAGVSHVAPFNDTDFNDWDYIIKQNLFSTLNCTRLAMDDMINKKEGSIVNISSIWGISGASCEAVYSASKGAINSFTKAMAKELGPSNITVNAICCGVIDTNMNDNLNQEEKYSLSDTIPLMRFGTSLEVANLVYSIAKNKYVTGQIISIDGGII